MSEPIEMPFERMTRVCPGKRVLDGVHSGSTWRIQLNDPCPSAMRPYVSFLTTCLNLVLILTVISQHSMNYC